ncbi:MAG: hypothetical protein R3C03_12305 [Pirellulaceae bacterium]
MSETSISTISSKVKNRPVAIFCVWLTITIFFLIIAGIWTRATVSNWNQAPGEERDDVFYDNIAFHLANGKGFRFDFANAEWLKPYEVSADAETLDWIHKTQVAGPTTARAPGLPIFLAMQYRIWGHQWYTVRWANLLIVSMGLSLLTCYFWIRSGSWWLVLIAVATLAMDYGVMQTPGQIMTEPLAIFTTSTLFVAIVEASRRGTITAWGFAGVTLAIAALVRSQINAWLLISMVITILLSVAWWYSRRPLKNFLFATFIFYFSVLLVSSPWWIRNCIVTQGLMPFGSAGDIGWAGGYCDNAYNNWGNWDLNQTLRAQTYAARSGMLKGKSLPEQEAAIGEISKGRAKQWVSRNFGKLPNSVSREGRVAFRVGRSRALGHSSRQCLPTNVSSRWSVDVQATLGFLGNRILVDQRLDNGLNLATLRKIFNPPTAADPFSQPTRPSPFGSGFSKHGVLDSRKLRSITRKLGFPSRIRRFLVINHGRGPS